MPLSGATKGGNGLATALNDTFSEKAASAKHNGPAPALAELPSLHLFVCWYFLGEGGPALQPLWFGEGQRQRQVLTLAPLLIATNRI